MVSEGMKGGRSAGNEAGPATMTGRAKGEEVVRMWYGVGGTGVVGIGAK